ncbi:tRNA 2-thiouridine(34) synthase MnmA [Candidatus Falkowbacteria bacterium]|nr:tRNA 2-thiouridine(34) synthase MnmA [Candidatus Falkowbacteria bacterium]
MKDNGKKVVVAMSGGVDSSVAAAVLKEQSYEVVGVFMQFWFPTGEIYGENRCCSLKSFNEAKQVADILDIPLHKLNFGVPFKKIIVDEFLKEYGRGKTPNPCVACNKFIKFDLLLKKARTIFGADYLATGHYVRLLAENPKSQILNPKQIQNPKFKIIRAKDKNKDQSYFLYNLGQSQLKYLLFPVGDYEKSEVRKLAKKFKLPVHDKKDSQEICFVGESHYDFLKKYLKLKPGKIITYFPPPLYKERPHINPPPLYKGRVGEGSVLGTHQGLPLYTIGQRSGIGLSGGPWYVCGFDRKKNLLIVTKNQKNSAIYQKEFFCYNINWIGKKPKFPLKCKVQIRYHGQAANCEINKVGNGLRVRFNHKQRAIMSGQSAVFYKKNELLGGGIIK